MPATDGSLIFNTKIDTSGLEKDAKGVSSKVVDLRNKVSSTAAAVKNLREELDKTANTKVKTKAAESIERDIAKAQEKLNSLDAQADRIIEKKRADFSIDKNDDGTLEYFLKQDKEWNKLQEQIDATEEKLSRYKRNLEQVNAAAPVAKDTAEYRKQEERLAELTGKLDVYTVKLREAEQEEQQNAAQTAQSAKRTSDYKQYLNQTIKSLRMFVSGLGKAYHALKKTFSNTVGRGIRNIGKHFGTANKSANVFEKSLRRIKNMLVRMFFYRLVHSPIDAIKDGLGEISKISPEVNKNLSALKTSSTYLKNSFAALAAPLLNLVTPAFVRFMDTVAETTDRVARLISVLAGQDSYTKAVKVQQDYTESLDKSTDSVKDNTKAVKENQKNLAKFDELNVMSDDGTDDNASSQSEQPMFEDAAAQIDEAEKGLLNALKKQDFIGLGRHISEKLNAAIDSVDWKRIGEKVSDYYGKALGFAYGFINGVDSAKLGESIGTLINSALSYYNSSLLGKTLSGFISKAFGALDGLIATVDWGKVSNNIIGFLSNFDTAGISRMAVRLIGSLTSAIQNTDFNGIGQAFSDGLAKVKWGKIWDNTAQLISSALKGMTDFYGLKGINVSRLTAALKNIKSPLSDIMGSVKDVVKNVLPSVVNNLLPSIVDFTGDFMKGLKPIVSSLSPVLKTVTDVTSRVIKTVSPIIKNIGDVIGKTVQFLEPIFTPLSNMITGIAELLGPALNAVLWTTGQLLDILRPINELVGGIIGLFAGDGETTISDTLQGEFDKLATVSGNLDTISDNIDTAISNVNDSLSQSASDLRYLDDLRDRMVELIDKSTLTPDEMNELQTIADLISEKVPEFRSAWDEMTIKDTDGKLAFNLNKEEMVASINSVIDKLKEQYATEALQDAYKQLYSDKIKTNQEVAEATRGVKDAQDGLNQAVEEYNKAAKAQADAGETFGPLADATKNAEKNLENYAEDLKDAQIKLLEVKGKQEEYNTKLTSLGNTLDVVSGKYDKNNKNLQALRDAYDNGFIDIDSLKKNFDVSADELFKGTKSMADQSVAGYKKGIALGAADLNKSGADIGSDVLKGAYDRLDINSPSKEFEDVADYSIQGYNRGIVKNMKTAIDLVKDMAGKLVDAMRIRLDPFRTMFDFIPEVVKSTLNNTIDLFQWFTDSIIYDINSLTGGFYTVNSMVDDNKVIVPQIPNIEIPRLAIGTVVPANYGEFLAVLGDNRREPEVVSPVSSIKQAVREVLAENGYGGDSDRPINVTVVLQDGSVLFRAMGEEDDKFYRSHGFSRFDRRKTT